ncbi:MAG: hypothetical protein HW374_1413, partial [Bacteroidetes bacterium]|nr:hypothetical protein [Bacteroidota bacterium]
VDDSIPLRNILRKALKKEIIVFFFKEDSILIVSTIIDVVKLMSGKFSCSTRHDRI